MVNLMRWEGWGWKGWRWRNKGRVIVPRGNFVGLVCTIDNTCSCLCSFFAYNYTSGLSVLIFPNGLIDLI